MTLHARRSAPGYFYSITDTASAAFLSQFCPISADACAILAQSARLPNAGGSQLRVGDAAPPQRLRSSGSPAVGLLGTYASPRSSSSPHTRQRCTRPKPPSTPARPSPTLRGVSACCQISGTPSSYALPSQPQSLLPASMCCSCPSCCSPKCLAQLPFHPSFHARRTYYASHPASCNLPRSMTPSQPAGVV